MPYVVNMHLLFKGDNFPFGSGWNFGYFVLVIRVIELPSDSTVKYTVAWL